MRIYTLLILIMSLAGCVSQKFSDSLTGRDKPLPQQNPAMLNLYTLPLQIRARSSNSQDMIAEGRFNQPESLLDSELYSPGSELPTGSLSLVIYLNDTPPAGLMEPERSAVSPQILSDLRKTLPTLLSSEFLSRGRRVASVSFIDKTLVYDSMTNIPELAGLGTDVQIRDWMQIPQNRAKYMNGRLGRIVSAAVVPANSKDVGAYVLLGIRIQSPTAIPVYQNEGVLIKPERQVHVATMDPMCYVVSIDRKAIFVPKDDQVSRKYGYCDSIRFPDGQNPTQIEVSLDDSNSNPRSQFGPKNFLIKKSDNTGTIEDFFGVQDDYVARILPTDLFAQEIAKVVVDKLLALPWKTIPYPDH